MSIICDVLNRTQVRYFNKRFIYFLSITVLAMIHCNFVKKNLNKFEIYTILGPYQNLHFGNERKFKRLINDFISFAVRACEKKK